MASRYVVNVQILRFFAAFSVTLAHVGIAVEERASSFRMIYPLDWGIGVDIFFIISGFIMYYLMHERFREPGVAGPFLIRRLLRIAPLYWLCTTLMLLSVLVAGSVVNNNVLDSAHIVTSYLFFPWPRADGAMFPLLSLGWTLNYEILFYLAFAGVLSLSRRAGLAVLVAGFALLVLAARLAPADWWLLRYWGDSIIGEFLLGILLAVAFMRGVKVSLPVSALLVVAGVALAIVFFQTQTHVYVGRFVTGGIPALLIAAGVILGPHAPVRRPYTWLAVGGDASYALYLTHPFVSKIVALVGIKIGLPALLTFGIGVAASVVASVAVYLLIEKPMGKMLGNLFLRRPARA